MLWQWHFLGRICGVTACRKGGMVAGIGVTGGNGRRADRVGGGGSSYDVGMWVCAVGGGYQMQIFDT
jgi:hypothetical protein